MAKAEIKECCGGSQNKNADMSAHAGGGAVYGLGFIGALVHFIQNATSFGDGLLGVLKALVWPALVVYQALINLKL